MIPDNKDYFYVIVKTNSSKNTAEWDPHRDVLLVSIKESPENNEANIAIEKYLFKLLKKRVKIVSGKTSKKKLVKILS